MASRSLPSVTSWHRLLSAIAISAVQLALPHGAASGAQQIEAVNLVRPDASILTRDGSCALYTPELAVADGVYVEPSGLTCRGGRLQGAGALKVRRRRDNGLVGVLDPVRLVDGYVVLDRIEGNAVARVDSRTGNSLERLLFVQLSQPTSKAPNTLAILKHMPDKGWQWCSSPASTYIVAPSNARTDRQFAQALVESALTDIVGPICRTTSAFRAIVADAPPRGGTEPTLFAIAEYVRAGSAYRLARTGNDESFVMVSQAMQRSEQDGSEIQQRIRAALDLMRTSKDRIETFRSQAAARRDIAGQLVGRWAPTPRGCESDWIYFGPPNDSGNGLMIRHARRAHEYIGTWAYVADTLRIEITIMPSRIAEIHLADFVPFGRNGRVIAIEKAGVRFGGGIMGETALIRCSS